MLRLAFAAVTLLALGFVLGPLPGLAAEGDAPDAQPQTLEAPLPDLFTITAQRIDASAGSAILARDVAMAQGRAEAWTRLYRRLTAAAQSGRQPQLSDAQLLRMVRNFQVAGERRSTTRYLADVTFRFNPAAVSLVLRQANIPYTDLRSKPALVIPLIEDKGFDANSDWAKVWNDPLFRQGLVPLVPAEGRDREFLARSDLMQLDWAGFQPLLDNRNFSAVVLAIASADGNTLQVIEITDTGRVPSAFGFAMSDAMANAIATAETVDENWKTRKALDFGTRGRLVADVPFESFAQWTRIRAQLRAVRAVTDVDVLGLSVNEAEISLAYFGRVEQLKDLLAQENLVLSGAPRAYSIELGRPTAAAVP